MAVAAPPIRVAFAAVRRRGAGWLLTWRIRNGGDMPVTVTEAWHPHRRCRSSRLRRRLRVPARGTASLELPARIDAAADDPVENCFVILRVTRGRGRWRVLTRFRLSLDGSGTPRPRVERIDIHAA